MEKLNFFDRKSYLDILDKHIQDLKDGYRRNVAFIGDDAVGKTSIIFKFLSKFSDNHIIIAYLEILPEPFESFARRFIGVLLYNFMLNSGRKLEERLDFLIAESEKYIPKTTDRIKLILSSLDKKKSHLFSDLLLLCDIIKQETGKSSVIIFDEFHNFESVAGGKNLFSEWAKALTTQKSALYIIVSSKRFRARAILSKSLSLLFGNFQIIEVEPFDIKVSEEYLEQRLTGLNINTGIKNFIVNFTGGFPYYLDVISSSVLKTDPADLTDILENLLFVPLGILNQRFFTGISHLLEHFKGDSEYAAILHTLACGHNRIRELAHILRIPKKNLEIKINRLIELDAISRSADYLKISDRVFGFWLRFVYQEKLNSLTFNAQRQRILFRENIRAMIQDFTNYAKRPVIERISELLHLFENDTIQIERKKIRLNHFREIKPLEFKRPGMKNGLIGRCDESLWIMALKSDSLNEEDIVEFSRECKKYRHKAPRKIIVALQDIDANARLKAMDEKIWTWDINNINYIFDLFFRPRLIP